MPVWHRFEETDSDMEPLQLVGIVAVALLVLGWLVVSFSAPGHSRTVLEWLSATAMYVALLALFVHLVRNAIEAESTVALIAFGFLCVLFGGGLLISIYRTIAAVRGAEQTGPTATN